MRIDNLTKNTRFRAGVYAHNVDRDGEGDGNSEHDGVTVKLRGREQNLHSYRSKKKHTDLELFLTVAELRKLLALAEEQAPEVLMAKAVGTALRDPEKWGAFTPIKWNDGRAIVDMVALP